MADGLASLESPRLVVRRPVASDQAAFAELLIASEAFHAPWFPERPKLDLAAALESFSSYLAGDDGERCLRRLIFARDPAGTLLGAINLNEIVRGCFQSAYLGYWLGSAHTGRGIMREALALVIGQAFGDASEGGLGLHRLEANIMPQNRASLAVVRALGFQREGYSPAYLKIAGRWQDHERWTLLRPS